MTLFKSYIKVSKDEPTKIANVVLIILVSYFCYNATELAKEIIGVTAANMYMFSIYLCAMYCKHWAMDGAQVLPIFPFLCVVRYCEFTTSRTPTRAGTCVWPKT